jgi:Pyruvate/2-oxoacid:ferredoxin oxidoreductase delta subunit
MTSQGGQCSKYCQSEMASRGGQCRKYSIYCHHRVSKWWPMLDILSLELAIHNGHCWIYCPSQRGKAYAYYAAPVRYPGNVLIKICPVKCLVTEIRTGMVEYKLSWILRVVYCGNLQTFLLFRSTDFINI